MEPIAHHVTARDPAGPFAAGVDRLLAGQPGATALLRRAASAAPADPRVLAALALALHRAGRPAAARRQLKRALAAAGDAPARERRRLEAVAAVLDGRPDAALRLLRRYLGGAGATGAPGAPDDALLVQEAVEIITWSGDGDPRAARRAFLDRLAPRFRHGWWFPGDYAFELAEAGRLPAALRLARHALALRPEHAGAAHALAHVCAETGDATGGAQFLRHWLTGYDPRGDEHSHLMWHLALFDLARGDTASADAVYARGLDPAALPHRRLVDAASFLWRRRLVAPQAGSLSWQPVRVLAARATARPASAFVDVHAAMAFAASGDVPGLRRLLRRMRRLAAGGSPARRVALALALACAAFVRADYQDAVRHLEPVMTDVPLLGGSNVQRAVFAATLAEARRRGSSPALGAWSGALPAAALLPGRGGAPARTFLQPLPHVGEVAEEQRVLVGEGRRVARRQGFQFVGGSPQRRHLPVEPLPRPPDAILAHHLGPTS
jgi:tetratricopeptide (TPR) repeat protein